MNPARRIKLLLLACVPMAVVAVLALAYAVPKHVGGLSGVMPLLYLVPVFIWGVMHPRDISFLALALIGLILDTAGGLPLGFSALLSLVFFVMVRSQRKYIYREGFAAMWGYFALMLMIMQAAGWAGYSYYYEQAAPVGNAFLQWLLSVLCYPPLHVVLYPWVERIGQARYRLLHA